MESIYELNEAVKKVIETANRVVDETNAEIWNKAPLIVHQKFCAELVRIMKEHPNKIPKDVPEAMEVITAVLILEKCYPRLQKI
jgi:uncharacterized NAD(P)/FAD-binding protein YdhS